MTDTRTPQEILAAIVTESGDVLKGVYLSATQLADLVSAMARREVVIAHLKARAPVTLAEWDKARSERNEARAEVRRLLAVINGQDGEHH